MTTKTTGSFNNNTTPPVDAQYLNIQRDEMNALCVIDGTTLDSSGIDNSQQAQAVKAYVSQAGILCTDSGSSANSYILTASSPFTNPPLKTGTRVRFKTANANTGSSTITPFGGSAITCKKSNGSTDLTTGDIPANTEVEFVYNGTNFVQSLGRVPATTTTQGVAFLSNPITISNNATTPNTDIDFTAGVFQFSDGSGQAVSTAMTKRLQSSGSWSAGNAGNMLLTGARANSSTYHLFAIYNPTTGVSDYGALLGVAGTAPDPTSVLPSGYTKFQRRGAVMTDGSGNIRGFTQIENHFIWKNEIYDLQGVSQVSASETLRTLTLPAGISTRVYIDFYVNCSGASASAFTKFYDASKTQATILNGAYSVTGIVYGTLSQSVVSNLSSQVKSNQVAITGSPSTNIYLTNVGYTDLSLKI